VFVCGFCPQHSTITATSTNTPTTVATSAPDWQGINNAMAAPTGELQEITAPDHACREPHACVAHAQVFGPCISDEEMQERWYRQPVWQ